MSVLVVGLSHASAPMATLERAVLTGEAQAKLLQDVCLSENVAGSLVLSTCNRVEVYADVDRFHGGVAAICELLARHSGVPLSELTGSAYVHYEDRAVQHLLAVGCGLESMVVGESQILGQVRQAIRLARQHGTLSRELSDLARLVLRTGKRAHAETGIDSAGQSLVSLGLELAARELGRPAGEATALNGLAVLVIGAGSMSSLATATAVRQGAGPVVIANRTRRSAERLAARFGGTATGLAEMPAALAAADIVITCTGASGHVVSTAMIADALRRRDPGGQVLLDLALPRDIEPDAGLLDRAVLIDLAAMGAGGTPGAGSQVCAAGLARGSEVAAVRRIVAQELAAYLQADRAPWAGSRTSCCTGRRSGSRSWPGRRAPILTRRHCGCSSSSIRRRSRQSAGRRTCCQRPPRRADPRRLISERRAVAAGNQAEPDGLGPVAPGRRADYRANRAAGGTHRDHDGRRYQPGAPGPDRRDRHLCQRTA